MANNQQSGGVGILGLLFVLFVGLKLTHNIDWSWWWVCSPLWVPLAILVAIFAGAVLVWALVAAGKGIYSVFSTRKRHRKNGLL
jgi:hypothetical protein